jgi:hypothetical protein
MTSFGCSISLDLLGNVKRLAIEAKQWTQLPSMRRMRNF